MSQQHHFELKIPGGKLVVVDFDVIEGRFRNVVISGDFFVYPEEEHPVIANALDKLVTAGNAKVAQAKPTRWTAV